MFRQKSQREWWSRSAICMLNGLLFAACLFAAIHTNADDYDVGLAVNCRNLLGVQKAPTRETLFVHGHMKKRYSP